MIKRICSKWSCIFSSCKTKKRRYSIELIFEIEISIQLISKWLAFSIKLFKQKPKINKSIELETSFSSLSFKEKNKMAKGNNMEQTIYTLNTFLLKFLIQMYEINKKIIRSMFNREKIPIEISFFFIETIVKKKLKIIFKISNFWQGCLFFSRISFWYKISRFESAKFWKNLIFLSWWKELYFLFCVLIFELKIKHFIFFKKKYFLDFIIKNQFLSLFWDILLLIEYFLILDVIE